MDVDGLTAQTAVKLVAVLGADDLSGRSDVALGDDIAALHLLLKRVDAELLRRVGAFDAVGGAGAAHACSTQAWLRSRLRISAGEAHGRVSVARRMRRQLDARGFVAEQVAVDEHGVVVDGQGTGSARLAPALLAGDVSYQHAAVITRALDQLPAEAAQVAEPLLVDTATVTDPGRLRRAADRIREVVEPEAVLADAQTAHERRWLNASTTLDGMVAVDALLDPAAGAVLLAAVHAYATPAGPEDTRTATQRRADAITDVLRAGLDAATTTVTGGEKPHVTLTVDTEPILTGQGLLVAEVRTAARAGDGMRLLGPALDAYLCDASITRILTAGPSEILDISRRTRIIPPALRRALVHRDGGCAFPHCDRPPAFTDAHHIIPWSQGGPTSYDNCVLLCRFHHTTVHDNDWTFEWTGSAWVIRGC